MTFVGFFQYRTCLKQHLIVFKRFLETLSYKNDDSRFKQSWFCRNGKDYTSTTVGLE